MATHEKQIAVLGQYQPLHISAAQATAKAIGALVDTTSTTAVTAAGSATITTAAAQDIAKMRPGMVLVIYGGTGTAEEVVVASLSLSAGTFTAVFANTHSGTYNITSKNGVFLGSVVVNAVGTGMTLTLYNGNPATGLGTGAPGYGALAVITPVAGANATYDVTCDYGLYFEYAGSSAGDLTIGYLPQQA